MSGEDGLNGSGRREAHMRLLNEHDDAIDSLLEAVARLAGQVTELQQGQQQMLSEQQQMRQEQKQTHQMLERTAAITTDTHARSERIANQQQTTIELLQRLVGDTAVTDISRLKRGRGG